MGGGVCGTSVVGCRSEGEDVRVVAVGGALAVVPVAGGGLARGGTMRGEVCGLAVGRGGVGWGGGLRRAVCVGRGGVGLWAAGRRWAVKLYSGAAEALAVCPAWAVVVGGGG